MCRAAVFATIGVTWLVMIGEEGVKLTMFIRSQVNVSSKKEREDWFETALNMHTPPLLPITPICLFAPF